MSTTPSDSKLQRNLTNRHIQLIAISGAIGTGLFMGSGRTIHVAGPSIVFVYMIIGFFLFFVMRAMGEILLSNLEYKSFSDFAADLLGPWAGFFTGWTYWFCWVVTGIADCVAISGYAQYWFPDIAIWIPMFITIAILLTLNLLTVGLFGETEFWFSMIKIVAILLLIVIGVFLIAIAFESPEGHKAAIENLWIHNGIFPNGIMGFFAGFQIAVFAFVGIELIGTTAAEAKDPEITLPRAINAVPIRVILFYVFALIIIMCVTPWNTISGEKSPFVELFSLIGLPAAAAIVNFVVITSAASSANSGIYSTSRMLFGLAKKQDAPSLFGWLSSRKVPANGLLFTCICLALAIFVLQVIPNVMHAFTVVTSISTILFIFVWAIILCSYVVYRRQRGALHQASNYKMPGGVTMCILCMLFFVFILVLLWFEPETREALIVTPFWFIVLTFGYLIRRKRVSQ